MFYICYITLSKAKFAQNVHIVLSSEEEEEVVLSVHLNLLCVLIYY